MKQNNLVLWALFRECEYGGELLEFSSSSPGRKKKLSGRPLHFKIGNFEVETGYRPTHKKETFFFMSCFCSSYGLLAEIAGKPIGLADGQILCVGDGAGHFEIRRSWSVAPQLFLLVRC